MPPPLGKKLKGRDGRRSSSRHTTPSSTISAPLASPTPTNTAFLEIPISNLAVPTNVKYEDILERHGGNGGIPDPKHLETIADSLKMLAKLAQSRSEFNDVGMRTLSARRKEALEQEREREAEARENERLESARREAQEEEEAREKANVKAKKKERSRAREELPQNRPLNHGAHGLARQDGLDLPLKASPGRASKEAATPPKHNVQALRSGSSSSLSEASPLPSPSATASATATAPAPPPPLVPTRPSSSDSSSSDDAHQPSKAASVPQYQTFGANPLIFDDPTIYEVKKVTEEMTDEEKKEIYAVSVFPHDDLSALIAGTPPNKDFSNAVKPNNQVQAHTFAAYLDGFLRPLKEEDIGFLKERGDRVTPFIMPRRGTKHYTEVWAEEDGGMAIDSPQDQLNPNQARGSIDQMDDDVAVTDRVSGGPMLNRLLSLMRFEHRAPPSEEKAHSNGPQTNGTQMNGSLNGDASFTGDDFSNFDPFAAEEAANIVVPPAPTTTTTATTGTSAGTITNKPLPPATFLPDSARPPTNAPNLTHAQVDDRLKSELRHLGILAADDEPDYDAHYDDVVAQRLRFLQHKLREVSTLNGARKQRVLELAEEQMAHQEYSTILEDLDSQVQTAYLKRARTAGKSKKNAKRPGGAGGGSHAIMGGMATTGGAGGMGGVSKPGIGDVARQLMNRRQRWESSIGPVFGGNVRRVRTEGESIFEEGVMKVLMEREKEKWEEEAE